MCEIRSGEVVLVAPNRHSSGILQSFFFWQGPDPDKKLTATDATDAKTQANSTSSRPKSNEVRPAPGFGQKSVNKLNLILLSRGIMGYSSRQVWQALFSTSPMRLGTQV